MRKAFSVSLLLIFVLAVLAVLLLAANIYTYHRLTAETVIAELRFEPTGDRQYLAHVRTGDRCNERVLPVLGEQWRVDAEFLKWQYWALLLGLDSQYRLDRLEGRYRSAEDQNAAPKIAHDLGDDTALDIVTIARTLGTWNFLLDATYGTSTYEDIDTARVYRVYRTATGIITRSEPRPTDSPPGEPLAIDVTAACGAAASVWQKVTRSTDGAAVALLKLGR
ncbi:MAG: hypothetical protein ABI640_15950 [Gammaproteobacteria bacterium]